MHAESFQPQQTHFPQHTTLTKHQPKQDFFKDYPPVAGGEQAAHSTADAADAPSPDPLQPFVLGAPDDEAPQQADGIPLPPAAGGPPPDEDEQPECAAVTEWRIQFARALEQKVAEEKRVKAERAEQAISTLHGMHASWEKKKQNAEEQNRASEREFIMKRDGVISRMTKKGEAPNWDIVPQLVDMTGKYKEGARDTSRMRQVLLRMKSA